MIYAFFVKWKKVKYLLVELFLFIVQIALSREFFGQIFPFGFVFALVRIYLEGNLLAVTIEYAVSNIFIGANFFMIVSVAFEIIVLSLYYFCNQTIKIKRKKLVLSLFLLLSSAVKLYLTITGNMFYVDFLLELGLKIVSLFYFLKLHEIYRKKFTFFKCGNLDYLFFSVFVVIFVLGAFKYELLRRSVGIFLFLSALFISCRFLPIDRFLVFSITLILCFGHIYSSINLIIFSY